MQTLTGNFSRFIRDDSGATAIEYGLILSLLVLGIIAAMTSAGEATKETFVRAGEGWIP